MHILLLILKILGITLGSIVGLVLLIILLVTLIPIRYAGFVHKHEKFSCKAAVSWLLHIVHVTVEYAGEDPVICVKVFGITVYPKQEKPQKEKKSKKKKAKKNKAKKKKTIESKVKDSKVNESEVKEPEVKEPEVKEPEVKGPEIKVPEPESELEPEPVYESKPSPEYDFDDDYDEIPDDEETKHIKNSIENIFRKVKDIYDESTDKFKKTVDNVAETVRNLYNKWVKVKAIIDDMRVRNALKLVLKQVGKIFKHILPCKIRGTFDYGFDDPSTTGYITAVCAALYGRLGKAFTFRPDFENKVLEADASFKGRIRIGRFIEIAVRVLLSKDCRYSYKLIKNFGDNDSDETTNNKKDHDSDFSDEPDMEEDF